MFSYTSPQTNKEALPADQPPSIDKTFHTRVEDTRTIFQRSLRRFGRRIVLDLYDDEGQTTRKKKRRRTRSEDYDDNEPAISTTTSSADKLAAEKSAGGRDAASTSSTTADKGAATAAAAGDPYWDSLDARNLFGASTSSTTADMGARTAAAAGDPYWDSLDARNLFGARPQDLNVRATIQRKISILQNANQQVKGYKIVIEGGDPLDECTESDIHSLRQRSLILILVDNSCLCRMGTNGGRVSFETCIQEILNLIANTGVDQQATYFVTVMRWNRFFREQELWSPSRTTWG